MKDTIIVFAGKEFTFKNIEIIKWKRMKYPKLSRTELAVTQIQEERLIEYCYAPVLLETFAALSHFAGTCYKASNWTFLSETKGRGRMDRNQEMALSRKAIYMYSLQKPFKYCLKGLKPCKVVNPDE